MRAARGRSVAGYREEIDRIGREAAHQLQDSPNGTRDCCHSCNKRPNRTRGSCAQPRLSELSLLLYPSIHSTYSPRTSLPPTIRRRGDQYTSRSAVASVSGLPFFLFARVALVRPPSHTKWLPTFGYPALAGRCCCLVCSVPRPSISQVRMATRSKVTCEETVDAD